MTPNKTKLSATTDAELREALDRATRDQYLRSGLLHDELRGLEYLYARGRKPAALRAAALCHRWKLAPTDWPEWVLRYIGRSATNVLAIPSDTSGHAKTGKIAHAFGLINKRTKGTKLKTPNPVTQAERDFKELAMVLDIARHQIEQGRAYRAKKTHILRHYVEQVLKPAEQTRWREVTDRKRELEKTLRRDQKQKIEAALARANADRDDLLDKAQRRIHEAIKRWRKILGAKFAVYSELPDLTFFV